MKNPKSQQSNQTGVDEAVKQLHDAAAAKKCRHCGCLRSSLRAIEEAYPKSARPEALASIVELTCSRLSDVKYDCLGCKVCWPALAINALGVEGDACPSEAAESREGWPPLPGSYHVLRYHAPVAVCALTDESLSETVVSAAGTEIAIVGTMQTENLGIERLMQNTLANSNIRFVVLCGADSQQAIGHLPGQSLIALVRSGVDERMRIIGAQGKRPVLRNVSREAIEHFRRTVEIVDMIGETSVPHILDTAKACAARNPGPAEPFAGTRLVATVAGYLPERMISDPAGYFVVFPDCGRGLLMLEHYRNDGVLDVVIEGRAPAEMYIPAIEKSLVSRLDHAAYLGKELARAEQALLNGGSFVQDAAPEFQTVNEHSIKPSACGCGSSCGEDKHA
ncbi:MAG: DUF4346 domain-containing protein [Verrucomicrobia bacterium]|nr:DUF4346 domain-containing protein [Verrucomicrobiota bacterium]